jgi:hypothetical protein
MKAWTGYVSVIMLLFFAQWVIGQDQAINGNLTVSGSVSIGTPIPDQAPALRIHLPGQAPFRLLPHRVASDDVLVMTYNTAWNGADWTARDVDGLPVARLGFENNYLNGTITQAEFNWDVADAGSGQPVFHRVFNFARATDGQATGLGVMLVPIQVSPPAGFDLHQNNGYALLVKNPVGAVYDSGAGAGAGLDVLTTNPAHANAIIRIGKLTSSANPAWALITDYERSGVQRFDIRDLQAAANRLEIDETGRVGIGSSPTSAQLTIGGTQDIQLHSIRGLNDLELRTSNGKAGLYLSDNGQVTITGGIRFTASTETAQTVCAAESRGTFSYQPGGEGTKDRVSVCVKNAANEYSWVHIY